MFCTICKKDSLFPRHYTDNKYDQFQQIRCFYFHMKYGDVHMEITPLRITVAYDPSVPLWHLPQWHLPQWRELDGWALVHRGN